MSHISKLVADKLGGLNNKTLELKNGFNIVYGPNEAGKSTWAALIKMIFYSWGRNKDEKLDYEKYCKDSTFMIKCIIDDYDGKRLILEKSKKEVCKAVFADTNKDCPELSGATPGEIMFGVDRETFEKTSFVGQLLLATGKSDGIEKKLAAILKTGDASGLISYEEAKNVLDDLSKEIVGNRSTSRIKNLRFEIDNLEALLIKDRGLLIKLNEDKVSLEKLEKEFAKYSALSNAQMAKQAVKTLADIEALRETVRGKLVNLTVLKGILTRDDITANDEFITASEYHLNRCETLNANLEILSKDSRAAFQDVELADAKLEDVRYFIDNDPQKLKESLDDIRNRISVQTQLREALKTNTVKSNLLVFVWATLAIFVLGLGVSLAVGFTALLPYNIGVIVALAAFAFYKLFSKPSKNKVERNFALEEAFNDKDALIEKSGCADVQEFEAKLNYSTAVIQELTFKKEVLEKAKSRESSKREEYIAAMMEFKTFAKKFFRNIEDLISVKGEISALRNQLSDISAIENEIKNANLAIDSLLMGNTEEQLKILGASAPAEFDESESANAKEKAEQIDTEIRRLREGIASESAQLGTKGRQLDEIETELEYKIELAEEFKVKDDALKIAMNVLGEAYQDFSDRYAPELAQKTQEIFEMLTGGRYDVAKMNSEFELTVSNSKSEKRLDEGKLSTGTHEQLWLALRLALIELIYSSSKMKPPIILDDVFVNFDDERCKKGLDYLISLRENTQIILFTCHSREPLFLKGNPNVNIIENGDKWALV